MRERIIMAQKAIDEVTLVDVTDGETGVSVDSITSFYYLGTDTPPAQPTTMSPPDPWTSTEPGYQEDKTLYRSERTLYKDGTFAYSQVQTDSAYAAAADAYKKSMQVSGDLTAYINAMKILTDDMQSQIDGAITTWFKPYAPTDDQLPTTDWTTTDLKNNHLGDLFYNTITGYVYRYQVQNNVYSWQRISDNDVVKAMEDAAKAQDTADSKRQVFVVTPKPPYDIGDLWVQGSNGDIMKCRIAKAETQSYSADDWVVASKYTDDTTANAAKQAATVAANKITISDHIPTASDSANKAIGSVWEVRSGNTVLSRYILESANTWKQVKVGQDFIGENAIGNAQVADLDVAKLTAGEAEMQEATIKKIASEMVTSNQFKTTSGTTGFNDTDGLYASHKLTIDYAREYTFEPDSTILASDWLDNVSNADLATTTAKFHTGTTGAYVNTQRANTSLVANPIYESWLTNNKQSYWFTNRKNRVGIGVWVYSDVSQPATAYATLSFDFLSAKDAILAHSTSKLMLNKLVAGWNEIIIASDMIPPVDVMNIGNINVTIGSETAIHYIDDLRIIVGTFDSAIRIKDDSGHPSLDIRTSGSSDFGQVIPYPRYSTKNELDRTLGKFSGQPAYVGETEYRWLGGGWVSAANFYKYIPYINIAGTIFASDASLLPQGATLGQKALVSGTTYYTYNGSAWVADYINPKIYQGTMVLNLSNAREFNLITAAAMTAILGHAWTIKCSASVMNGDRGNGSPNLVGVDWTKDGLNCRADGAFNGLIRINYMIVDAS
jgi:hypothetical protein